MPINCYFRECKCEALLVRRVTHVSKLVQQQVSNVYLYVKIIDQLADWLISLTPVCDVQVGITSEDGGGDALGAQRRSAGVVVFVKDDQHSSPEAAPPRQHQQRHLLATGGDLVADSSSNTDSGNGTSEYSDDASPPLIHPSAAAAAAASPRHCISSAPGDTPSSTCWRNCSSLFQFYTREPSKQRNKP